MTLQLGAAAFRCRATKAALWRLTRRATRFKRSMANMGRCADYRFPDARRAMHGADYYLRETGKIYDDRRGCIEEP